MTPELLLFPKQIRLIVGRINKVTVQTGNLLTVTFQETLNDDILNISRRSYDLFRPLPSTRERVLSWPSL